MQSIGFKRKESRLVFTRALAAFMLFGVFDTEMLYPTLIFEAVLVPVILLWLPDYRDAKFLQGAYDRALKVSQAA